MKVKPETSQKGVVSQSPDIDAQPAELNEESLDEVTGGKPSTTFTSVSNFLKIRHETAKNSISNIR